MEPSRQSSSSRLPLPSTSSKFGGKSFLPSFIPKPGAAKGSATVAKAGTYGEQSDTVSKLSRQRMALLSGTMARPKPYPSSSFGQSRMTTGPRARVGSSMGISGLSAAAQVATRLTFDDNLENQQLPSVSIEGLTPPKRSLDALSSTLKKALNSHPPIDWQVVNKDSEIINLKTQNQHLDGLVEGLRTAESELRIHHTKELENARSDLLKERNRNIDLENEVRLMKAKEEGTRLEMEGIVNDFQEERDLFDKRLFDLQKDNSLLRDQASSIESELEAAKRRHANQIMSFEHQINVTRADAAKSEQEKAIYMKQLEELYEHVKSMDTLQGQLGLAQEEVKRLTQELKNSEDGNKLAHILQGEMRELRDLQNENRELNKEMEVLRNSRGMLVLLQQQVDTLTGQLNESKTRLSNALAFERETLRLRHQLKEMEAAARSKAAAQLSFWQENEQRLQSEVKSLKGQVLEAKVVKAKADESSLVPNKDVAILKKKVEEQMLQIKRLNRKCLLVIKERDSYKKVIDSYEHEVTINDANGANRERISALESNLGEYRTLVDQLENELKQLKDGTLVTQYKQQVDRLQKEMEGKSAELKSALEESASLREADPTPSPEDSRVIHLKHNPLDEKWRQQSEHYKQLLGENQRLAARLELLESGTNADITRQADEGVKNAGEVEKLRKQVNLAEKRQNSIMDAFKKTSKEFREVVYILTGYRIDALKQRIYRLSHVYADSPNDILLFELESSGTMKLLQNEYSERLSDIIDTYLKQSDSYPAFLSALCLDLFRKQTMMCSSSQE